MIRAVHLLAAALLGVTTVAIVSCGKGASETSTPTAKPGSTASASSAGAAPAPVSAAPQTSSASTGAPLRPQGATAENPDAETVALIYFSLAGQTPPFDDWAHQDFQYVQNEFDRSKKIDAALAAFKSKFAFAGTVGHIVLPMQSQISEYDDKVGEFYVDCFSPSTTWSFPYKGGTYRIEFVNGDQAQHWKVAQADAPRIVERNSGNHGVTVSAVLDLVGTQPTADGGTITALVKSYTVESAFRHEPLGTVTTGQANVR